MPWHAFGGSSLRLNRFHFNKEGSSVCAMKKEMLRFAALAVVLTAIAGCTSVSSNYGGDRKSAGQDRIRVCHGFDCYFQNTVTVSPADRARFASIMAAGAGSPEAERDAISRAIMLFEDMATATIGIADGARSSFRQSGRKGQMDCIDESTNSRSLLLFLNANGWLQHHEVLRNVSRGAFIDARYPHSTAVVREKASGRKWAVDSWYEAAGDAPDIVPLEKWRQRGVWGER